MPSSSIVPPNTSPLATVVTVEGLVLVAESAKGRRNRIGTVLVRRADDQPHTPDPSEEPTVA